MMKAISSMSIEELGAYICDELQKEGVDVVLSGGACVQIYSYNQYMSWDIDLINRYNDKPSKIKKIMLGFGFYEENKYFVHKDTKYFIEFPPGPLGVGDELVGDIALRATEAGVLRLLTPTDCVKDRLSAYYHWNDLQSLHQAVWVAKNNEIDTSNIKAWSAKEGMSVKFADFETALSNEAQSH
jgi:hypothetical protein